VITIIVLVLAIAIPGLARMHAEARLSAAQQQITSLMTRAYYAATTTRGLTAVRFMPAQWTGDPNANPDESRRQHLAVYSYVSSLLREQPPGSGFFVTDIREYFERVTDIAPVALPEDVWIAPSDALGIRGSYVHSNGVYTPCNNLGQQFVLRGPVNQFRYVADPVDSPMPGYTIAGNQGSFLNADDFLIVIDSATGVRGGAPRPYRVKGYAPPASAPQSDGDGYEAAGKYNNYNTQPFLRYAFSGVVAYRREPFVALGDDAVQRQDYLRTNGRVLLANRFGGGLRAGLQRPQ